MRKATFRYAYAAALPSVGRVRVWVSGRSCVLDGLDEGGDDLTEYVAMSPDGTAANAVARYPLLSYWLTRCEDLCELMGRPLCQFWRIGLVGSDGIGFGSSASVGLDKFLVLE
jgi:hypothetical protein